MKRLPKIERLKVAAKVAPVLRSEEESTRTRRVARLDEAGNVIGYTTLGELQKALLVEHEVEFDVDGRPKSTRCTDCGRVLLVRKTGRVPKACRPGHGCRAPSRSSSEDAAELRSEVEASVRCSCGAAPESEHAIKHVANKLRNDQNYIWKCKACFSRPRPLCACGASVSYRREKRDSGKCGPCYANGAGRPLPQATCITCPRVPKRNSFMPSIVRQRKGRPWQCFECTHGGVSVPSRSARVKGS